MIVESPGSLWSASLCARYGQVLVKAVGRFYRDCDGPSGRPPAELLAILEEVVLVGGRFEAKRAEIHAQTGSAIGSAACESMFREATIDDVIDTAAAAKLIRCSESYVRRLVRQGELQAAEPGKGGAHRVLRSSVDDYLRKRAA